MISVRITGEKENAMRFLLEQPGIARVLDANDRLQLEFTGDDSAQVALLSRLVGAGFPVLEFNTEGAGLEDLFMKITEGKVQ
jgi:hypothetical protein